MSSRVIKQLRFMASTGNLRKLIKRSMRFRCDFEPQTCVVQVDGLTTGWLETQVWERVYKTLANDQITTDWYDTKLFIKQHLVSSAYRLVNVLSVDSRWLWNFYLLIFLFVLQRISHQRNFLTCFSADLVDHRCQEVKSWLFFFLSERFELPNKAQKSTISRKKQR